MLNKTDISLEEQLQLFLTCDDLYGSQDKEGFSNSVNYKFLKKIKKEHQSEDLIKAVLNVVNESSDVNLGAMFWLAQLEIENNTRYFSINILSNKFNRTIENQSADGLQTLLDYCFQAAKIKYEDIKNHPSKPDTDYTYVRRVNFFLSLPVENAILKNSQLSDRLVSNMNDLIAFDGKRAIDMLFNLPVSFKDIIYTSKSTKDVFEDKALQEQYLKEKINHLYKNIVEKKIKSKSASTKTLNKMIANSISRLPQGLDATFGEHVYVSLFSSLANLPGASMYRSPYNAKNLSAIVNAIDDMSLTLGDDTKFFLPPPKILESFCTYNDSIKPIAMITKMYSDEDRKIFAEIILRESVNKLPTSHFESCPYKDILSNDNLKVALKSSTRCGLTLANLVSFLSKSSDTYLSKNFKSDAHKDYFDFYKNNLDPSNDLFGYLFIISSYLSLEHQFPFDTDNLKIPPKGAWKNALDDLSNMKNGGDLLTHIQSIASKNDLNKKMKKIKSEKDQCAIKRKI